MIRHKQALPLGQVRPIRRVGFLVLDGFAMPALSRAIEVLRAANRIVEAGAYSWTIVTQNGEPVRASDGLMQAAAVRYSGAGSLDLVVVCGDTGIEMRVDGRVIGLLHQMASDGVALGGMCTGAYALLKAGLMEGYSCSVQWDDMALLRRAYANVTIVDRHWVIDRDRLTCAGGSAPSAMMLDLVAARFDAKVAADISERTGTPSALQPLSSELSGRLGRLASY